MINKKLLIELSAMMNKRLIALAIAIILSIVVGLYINNASASTYQCSDIKNATPVSSQVKDCSAGTTQADKSSELCPLHRTSCTQKSSTPSCPSGYNLQGNDTCTETLEKTPVCPSGSTLSNNECLTSSQCPSGYAFTNNTCTETLKKTAACSSGILSGGECVTTLDSTPSCPSGYNLQGNNTCKKTETLKKTATCPNYSNFTLRGYTCTETVKKTEAVTYLYSYSCPSEESFTVLTTWQRRSRIKNFVIKSENKKYCTASWKFFWTWHNHRMWLPKTGTLPTIISKSPSCPSGYNLQGNDTCTKPVKKTKTAVCPNGYAKQGNDTCTFKKISTASSFCSSGSVYDRSANKCVTTLNSTPVCPSGYNFTNNECTEIKTKTAVCPNGISPQPLNLSTGIAVWKVKNSNYNKGQSFNAHVVSNNSCVTHIPSGSKYISVGSDIPNGKYIYKTQFYSPASGTLNITIGVDDYADIYLNNKEIGSTDNNGGNSSCWTSNGYTADQRYTGTVKAGQNVLSIDAYNNDGHSGNNNGGGSSNPGGIAAKVTVTYYRECISTPSCPSGYNLSNDTCTEAVKKTPVCPSGYTLQGNECVSPWACPAPSTNEAGTSDICIKPSGTSKYYCSPYSCIDTATQPVIVHPALPQAPTVKPVGKNAKPNSTCSNSIQIFAGSGDDCQSGGTQTTYINCCNSNAYFLGACTGENDKILHGALYYDQSYGAPVYPHLTHGAVNGSAIYVGSYCSDKWPFGICAEKSQTFCNFKTLLAAVIQQQGRKQLDIGYGTPQHPQCSGFTPEQFQELDFSKMNLSIYTKVMIKKIGNSANLSSSKKINNMQQKLNTTTKTLVDQEL